MLSLPNAFFKKIFILLNYHRGNPPFFLTKYWYIVDEKYVQINTDKAAINHEHNYAILAKIQNKIGRQHFPN